MRSRSMFRRNPGGLGGEDVRAGQGVVLGVGQGDQGEGAGPARVAPGSPAGAGLAAAINRRGGVHRGIDAPAATRAAPAAAALAGDAPLPPTPGSPSDPTYIRSSPSRQAGPTSPATHNRSARELTRPRTSIAPLLSGFSRRQKGLEPRADPARRFAARAGPGRRAGSGPAGRPPSAPSRREARRNEPRPAGPPRGPPGPG